jgi:peptidoglycan/xylan/chitin deacetylase (PgdA/CDA1 family)
MGRSGRQLRRLGVSFVALTSAAITLNGPPAGAAAPVTPPVVSLTFDDQRVSQGVVDALLASHHMVGTFYIITRAVNVAGSHPESLSWAQIRRLAHDGNEIAGHTRTHPDLAALNPAAQTEEICGSRRDLAAQGIAAISFAYPYGDSTPTTERIVQRCGFASGRGAWGGAETIPPPDRYAMRTLDNVVDTDTVARLEAETAQAKPGQWLQYVFHDVGNPYPGGDQYRIGTAVFAAFLDWLAGQRNTGRVMIRTVAGIVH